MWSGGLVPAHELNVYRGNLIVTVVMCKTWGGFDVADCYISGHPRINKVQTRGLKGAPRTRPPRLFGNSLPVHLCPPPDHPWSSIGRGLIVTPVLVSPCICHPLIIRHHPPVPPVLVSGVLAILILSSL